jgi:hypothetical protein
LAKKKWHNEVILLNHPIERIPVSIVHDSALANRDVCGGRMVPLLFLDTSERPDVKTCLEVHRESQIAGEVKTSWGRRDSPDSGPITLMIRFQKPAVCTIILHFDLEKYGGLVDQIVRAKAVWLTWGAAGDGFLDAQERIKVLVQIESEDFCEQWDDVLDKTLQKQARRGGATKQEAKDYSLKVRQEWRKVSDGFAG